MRDRLFSKFEIKDIGTDDESGYATFSGYASVFDYLDSQMDIVQKGAFSKSLMKNPNVKMLWQHDRYQPIGKYTKLMEDAKGLYVEGEICLDVPQGKATYGLLKQGALDSLSIGYITKDAEITNGGVRILKELDLFEISVVTFPANDMAMIDGVKSFVQARGFKDITIRDFERKLRDVFNCTQSEAKLVASKGFNAINNRDGQIENVPPANDPWDAILSDFIKQAN